MILPTPAEAAAVLGDPRNAISAVQFPINRLVANRPGLYSWWVDDAGRQVLEEVLQAELPDLIYAGQAGASSARSRRASTATLLSRIGTNHLRGTVYGSTFRKSMAAILREPLALTVEAPDRLTKADNDRLSHWIRAHLSLALYPYDDQDTLGAFEDEVLAILDPPLNLDGIGPTPVRRRLSELRREISRPPVVHLTKRSSEMRFMVPTRGPDDWRRLLADPQLHWVRGRSARTMACAWEEAGTWPPEVAAALSAVPELSALRPIWGFPEWKTPLPGGNRKTQTDLLVVASDGEIRATFAFEGKVDESFGEMVDVWLHREPSPGKETRIAYLADLLGVSLAGLLPIRYQLVHRAGAAKIEAARNGSSITGMLVHSWAPSQEGWIDFETLARLLGVNVRPGVVAWSEIAGIWLGWIVGDPKFLAY